MKGSRAKICAVSNVTRRRNLGKAPVVVCARCGATAHSKLNVCDPVALEPDH